MTRNDIPDKLEWSIHPCSGTDSAQWDWGFTNVTKKWLPFYQEKRDLFIFDITGK